MNKIKFNPEKEPIENVVSFKRIKGEEKINMKVKPAKSDLLKAIQNVKTAFGLK